MPIICPTVTTDEAHAYREQIERAAKFTKRIHIDLADGQLTPNNLVAVEKVWWPEDVEADIHLMFLNPMQALDDLIKLKPSLIIVHAEAEGDFVDMAERLHDADIKVGVALLQDTEPIVIKPVIDLIDHVLIFSGDLGHFGGQADLSLTGKASELKSWKKELEIGWDGGINDQNARQLAENGIDVLNVGGYIQRSTNPGLAYAKLISVAGN